MRRFLASPLWQLIRVVNPPALLAGVLFFALGAGIVDFRNQPFSGVDYWLGQACITLLQMSSALLKAFYDRAGENESETLSRRPNDKESKVEQEGPQREVVLPRSVLLSAGLTTLSIGAAITVLLLARGALNGSAL
ncbi:MAG: hypothetical protein N3A60_01130, partial [Thermanaerothrix sp.]|nr:hypothetical protein [Thermanaerothrix sp.]